MTWLKRISFFLIVNFLVVTTISITFTILMRVFNLDHMSGQMIPLLIFCSLMGFGGSLISLMISKWMAKRAFGVQIIDTNTSNPDHKDLVRMVHTMAQQAGLENMPEVGIYESPDINAFATGPSKKNSLVAVSTGLLRSMNKSEVEGVIGHEVAHIANGDMVTMTLIQGIVNTFVLFLSRIAANILSSQAEDRNRPMVQFALTILFDILFGILGSVAVNYFSRQREFRADYGGAKFAGREKMIAGLRKLQKQFENIEPDNGGMATMKISNRSSGLLALFSTHPSLETRIQRLEQTVIVR